MAKMAKSLWTQNLLGANLCLPYICLTQNIWIHLELKENLELECGPAQPYLLYFLHLAGIFFLIECSLICHMVAVVCRTALEVSETLTPSIYWCSSIQIILPDLH